LNPGLQLIALWFLFSQINRILAVQLLKTILKSLVRIIIATTFGVTVLLLVKQHSMIYHPRSYEAGEERGTTLAYSTSEGRQLAFYIPPDTGGEQAPDRLWVLFSGNASLALDWLGFVERYPGRHDGFLLVDYPGYGRCEGSASPRSIEESTEAAFDRLAQRLHTTRAVLDGKLGVVGHSLGCAAALDFAVNHPVDRVVLLSPFTTLREMAQKTVGWPLCWLLRHKFDNRARLAELAARGNPPRVDLFHGSLDEVIPVRMGSDLAVNFPRMIAFHEVPEATHNMIQVMARDQIFAAMQKPGFGTGR
jgi:pimeloyl-ACP methyl ester carboxylesterase